jgi:uncharacterized protein YbjT (DUF2867 family)
MRSSTLRVFVAGATGRFGAIVAQLTERGHWVRAGARDVGAAAADSLRRLGAEVVRADFDDADSLARAARGVDAVFATGTAHRSGPRGEFEHGRTLARAVASAGAGHLVFVSGAGAHAPTGVPVLEAKRRVEEAIRNERVAFTLLAPVYLMENLFNPWIQAGLRTGALPSPVAPTLKMQQVAVADILALAVLAVEQPDRFAGERIEIASDELSGLEAASTLSRALDTPLRAIALPQDGLPPALRALFDWLARASAPVDVGALHEQFPEVGWHRFDAWAKRHAPRLKQLLAKEEPNARGLVGG